MKNNSFYKRLLASGSALQVLAVAGGSVAALSIAAPAAAQDYTAGAISGTVVDESGAPVSGATVTAISVAQGFTRTATTGENGSFRFNSLPAGSYDITVTGPGIADYTAEGVRVLASQSIDVALEVSSTNVIVVTGRSVTRAFEGTTTGLNVDVEELQKRVPIGRSLDSVIQLAPGTTQGDSAFGSLTSIGGSSVAENAYYLNGLNITNFDNYLGSARVPFEFYQSVEVKSGGYPAEFGRATGGIVNAVSKSGTNEWSGAARVYWEPEFLRSDGKDQIRNSLGGPITYRALDEADSLTGIFELGGPIFEDRLFAYGLVEMRDVEQITFNRASGDATRQKTNDPFWAVKVDAYPIDSQHFEFTIFDTTRSTLVATAPFSETAGETTGQFSDIRQDNFGGVSYVGKYTGNFTDFLTISAAYGKMRDRFDSENFGPTDPLVWNLGSGPIGGVPAGGYATDQRNLYIDTPYNTEREFYRADADVFVNFLGNHHFRFGYDQENNTLERASVTTGGDYELANGLITPEAYNAGVGGAGFLYLLYDGAALPGGGTGQVVDLYYLNSGGAFTSTNRAFYIQDEWEITDRLTINLGVRRDDFNVDDALGNSLITLKDNYAPRVGFEYALGEDRSTRVYGFFGQYFLPVASNSAYRNGGSEYFFRQRFAFNGLDANGIPIVGTQITGATDSRYSAPCPFALNPALTAGSTCRVTGDGTVAPTDSTISKDLQATKESEFIIGGETTIGEWRVGLSFTHRNLDRSAEDASIDNAAVDYCIDQGYTEANCSAIWTGFHQYVFYNIGGDLNIALDASNAAASNPAGALDGQFVSFTADELGFPKPERKYNAVELTFDRDWDGNWSLGGSYTWSESKGNSEGFVQSDFGQSDAGATQDFDSVGFTDYAYGYLPNHRRHRFKAYGAVGLGESLIIGSNLSVESPRPLSCFGYHPTDVNANEYGAASHYCGLEPAPRGEGLETDWFVSMDLSARYNIEMATGNVVTLGADVFNLFNRQGVTQRIETGDLDITGTNADGTPSGVSADPDYGLASGYQSPRSVRLTASVTF